MVLGETPDAEKGLSWEVRKLVEMNAAEKFILVVPPLSRKKVQRRWDSFCQCLGNEIEGEIAGDERFIRFRADWSPMAVTCEAPIWKGRNRGRAYV